MGSEKKRPIILITGANGCIGSELVYELLSRNYEIYALALDKSDICNIRNFKPIKILYGNICDIRKMEKIFNKYRFDIVIHLAALVHKPNLSENEYMRVNYIATKDIIDLSIKNGTKQFIFISSVAVYGEKGSTSSINEISKLKPETTYARSKYQSELYLKSKSDNINYTIIRPTTVYGKYDNGNINKLFQFAKRGIVPILGNGKNIKSFVFVENLINGIRCSLLNKKAYNEIFIISDLIEYSIIDIIKTMGKVIGKKIIIFKIPFWLVLTPLIIINKIAFIFKKRKMVNIYSIKKLTTNHVFSISKAVDILEYKPKYDLEDGLRLTYIAEKKGD